MAFRIKSERIRGIESKPFREGGKKHYSVRIFLDADSPEELDQVDSVQYELHPTFRNRQRVSSNRATQFEIIIWSYGFFTAKAKIVKKDKPPENIEGFIRWSTAP
ncbi:MAG: hypothetical protein O2909_09970 [Chloroflexi bacterium]|nr:hypothetical protein [Chloroflexota bacterium]MDA1219755.1 hypothetical protein [Chloroflexota bacterium]